MKFLNPFFLIGMICELIVRGIIFLDKSFERGSRYLGNKF